jgi:hypothetical protein
MSFVMTDAVHLKPIIYKKLVQYDKLHYIIALLLKLFSILFTPIAPLCGSLTPPHFPTAP